MQANNHTIMSERITITALVDAPILRAWEAYTKPEDIVQWNHASPDWHCPRSENDLRVGGTFSYRMEAKDGSDGFDFEGTYTDVVPHERIAYTMGDGRKVETTFREENGMTRMMVVFDPENENPIDMQRAGWQSILDQYAAHAKAK